MLKPMREVKSKRKELPLIAQAEGRGEDIQEEEKNHEGRSNTVGLTDVINGLSTTVARLRHTSAFTMLLWMSQLSQRMNSCVRWTTSWIGKDKH